MKRALFAIFCAACVVGPKFVSAPMLSSIPVASGSADASDEEPNMQAEQPQPTLQLEGTWAGRVWQTGNVTYPLTVTFQQTGADVIGRVHYSDQHCSAEWHLRRDAHGHWAGQETVLVDPFNRCLRGGRVTISAPEDATLRWSWIAPGRTATASLERTQP